MTTLLWTIEEPVPGSPLVEPVTLLEAKAQVEVEAAETYWDTTLGFLTTAARRKVEGDTGYALVSRGFIQHMNRWPCDDSIKIRRNPVTAAASVVWTDSAGVAHTLTVNDDYELDLKSRPARVNLPANGSWPGGQLKRTNPIAITFTAGFGATAPELTQYTLAMRLLISHWFQYRGAITAEKLNETPLAYQSMIDLGRTPYFGEGAA